MKDFVGDAFRALFSKLGYVLIKPNFSRFGNFLFSDVSRLSKSWDWSIETIFDVGANTGQFAGEALEGLPKAFVHSFEPHPIAYSNLKRVAASNRRLIPHELALGAEAGEATLYTYGSQEAAASMNSLTADASFAQQFAYKPSSAINVRCTTLDAFCAENKVQRIDLLKVDTEGFDLFVLRGADRMFHDARVRFIYVEFNSLLPQEGVTGGALMPIAQYLSQFGFVYLCSYSDRVLWQRRVSVCSNALFAAPPSGWS